MPSPQAATNLVHRWLGAPGTVGGETSEHQCAGQERGSGAPRAPGWRLRHRLVDRCVEVRRERRPAVDPFQHPAPSQIVSNRHRHAEAPQRRAPARRSRCPFGAADLDVYGPEGRAAAQTEPAAEAPAPAFAAQDPRRAAGGEHVAVLAPCRGEMLDEIDRQPGGAPIGGDAARVRQCARVQGLFSQPRMDRERERAHRPPGVRNGSAEASACALPAAQRRLASWTFAWNAMPLPHCPDGCSICRCYLPHFSRPVPREAAISASPDRRPDLATLLRSPVDRADLPSSAAQVPARWRRSQPRVPTLRKWCSVSSPGRESCSMRLPCRSCRSSRWTVPVNGTVYVV